MSLNSKKELVMRMKDQYAKSTTTRRAKQEILDMLIAATGYKRKYAICLLNSSQAPYKKKSTKNKKNTYDDNVKNALLTIWNASNRICSKRLVPFIPAMIEVLERNGHIFLTQEIKSKLCAISSSSVDRLLKQDKDIIRGKAISTTKAGQLLKNQIKVRTFADWDEVVPGFIETDLVAHCGGNIGGSFLNTLTLTDIDSTWTECLPLLYRSAENVIKSLSITMEILPFKILGIDVDNGSEFINHALIKFCEDNGITFTRSRAYKKNDQAHVEERNGSIVRRLVGYDRFEGTKSWQALTELYSVIRLYVNFFQPSLKLLSKSRSGAKVTKKYDVAKTPHQRLLESSSVSAEIKDMLNNQYKLLDPIVLLSEIKNKQHALWKLGFKVDLNTLVETEQSISTDNNNVIEIHTYKKNEKLTKKQGPRTWRTRKDPFEDVYEEIEVRLQLDPAITARALLDELIANYPNKFSKSNLRALQNRLAQWRKEQLLDEVSSRAKEASISGGAEDVFIEKVLGGIISNK